MRQCATSCSKRESATVYTKTVRLPAAGFDASRAADVTLTLPVGTLLPGPHLLTVQTSPGSGAPLRRDVRFEVLSGRAPR